MFSRNFIVCGAAEEPSSLPSWVPSAGGRVKIGANTMDDVKQIPAGGNATAFEIAALIEQWQTSIFAADVGDYGAILQWGAGHGRYQNGVYQFKPADDAENCLWSRIKDCSSDADASLNDYEGDATTGELSDGTPSAPHVYDEQVYVPASVMGNTSGSLVQCQLRATGVNGNAKFWAWAYDIGVGNSASAWSKATNVTPSNELIGSGVYDSTRGVIWYLAGGSLGSIGKLDPTTMTWASIAHAESIFIGSTTVGGYCPTLDCVVWWFADTTLDAGNGVLYIWKPNEAGTDGTLTVDATQSGTPPEYTSGLEWCSHASVQKFYGFPYRSRNVTITIASPGVVTWTAHGLPENTEVRIIALSGSLPTGIVDGTTYFVRNPTTDTFEVAATSGGASINTTGSQSGTHRGLADYPVATAKTLTPPASLPGTWTWGAETFTAEGGAGAIANASINPRYNALRYAPNLKSFLWVNDWLGEVDVLRPAAAT